MLRRYNSLDIHIMSSTRYSRRPSHELDVEELSRTRDGRKILAAKKVREEKEKAAQKKEMDARAKEPTVLEMCYTSLKHSV